MSNILPRQEVLNTISRRTLLRWGLATGASLLPCSKPVTADEQACQPWFERTIPQLQALMGSRALTSRELTLGYLQQIEQLNPLLNAVIEANPNALSLAAQRDADRRAGRVLGPLHGIPILVKDNIATADNMETTAGSLALVNSRVPDDAAIVAKLRAAGAVILGKANLSEWANFRGDNSISGWSARGGFTRCPYLLDFEPCGSSSGSAVAAAANMCAAAVGTETVGSILCPSGDNQVVGLKPTVGVVSQDGIIPVARSQDTAGPITRTVTDAAIMLGVLQSPVGPIAQFTLPPDYTVYLQRGALRGARIGVDYRYLSWDYGADPETNRVAMSAIDVMKSLGATVESTDTGDVFSYFDDVFTAMLYEFKLQLGGYLARLSHTNLRSLRDLIEFNFLHCNKEMQYFGQELFQLADGTSGDLNDPIYIAARHAATHAAREEGIDRALREDRLDAIVAPSYGSGAAPAAVAGYPSISIPAGVRPDGSPVGLWMYAGYLREGSLLGFAYDLEQELQARKPPRYLGSAPPLPPDANLCATFTSPQLNRSPVQRQEATPRDPWKICCSLMPHHNWR